jgi:hypothetical protein
MTVNSEIPFDQPNFKEMVEKRVTCPFVGSAVMAQRLPVLNTLENPLARIEDVRRLGNTGEGDLGNVLKLFASGNHAFMHGPVDQLNQPVPEGLFCLDFPGSQGSHPGHSGILETDPHHPGSGQFSQLNFDRLKSRATKGFVTRSEVANFIAENLHRDTQSRVSESTVLPLVARNLGQSFDRLRQGLLDALRGSDELSDLHRVLQERVTSFAGDDNLLGSCGEFGLLFAFFANKPGAEKINGEPALSIEDLELMFKHKRLPDGWDTWKKTKIDWVVNSTELMIHANRAYFELRAGTTPEPT